MELACDYKGYQENWRAIKKNGEGTTILTRTDYFGISLFIFFRCFHSYHFVLRLVMVQ